jgi:hypothetical protein
MMAVQILVPVEQEIRHLHHHRKVITVALVGRKGALVLVEAAAVHPKLVAMQVVARARRAGMALLLQSLGLPSQGPVAAVGILKAQQKALVGLVVVAQVAHQAGLLIQVAALVVAALVAALAWSSFGTQTLLLRQHRQQALRLSPCLVGIVFISGPLQVPLLSEVPHGKKK